MQGRLCVGLCPASQGLDFTAGCNVSQIHQPLAVNSKATSSEEDRWGFFCFNAFQSILRRRKLQTVVLIQEFEKELHTKTFPNVAESLSRPQHCRICPVTFSLALGVDIPPPLWAAITVLIHPHSGFFPPPFIALEFHAATCNPCFLPFAGSAFSVSSSAAVKCH